MSKKTESFPPVSPRIEQALKICQSTMLAIFGRAENNDPRISVELEREGAVDTIVIDSWLYLNEDDYEEEIPNMHITGRTLVKQQGWALAYGVYDPGVHYHNDGSGTPPSFDLEDCNPPRVLCLHQAIEIFCGMIVKNIIQQLAENNYEAP